MVGNMYIPWNGLLTLWSLASNSSGRLPSQPARAPVLLCTSRVCRKACRSQEGEGQRRVDADSLDPNTAQPQVVGWRGNFLLSAAEQWLKLELTKNFKVRDSQSWVWRITGTWITAHSRLGLATTTPGSGLVQRVLTAI